MGPTPNGRTLTVPSEDVCLKRTGEKDVGGEDPRVRTP